MIDSVVNISYRIHVFVAVAIDFFPSYGPLAGNLNMHFSCSPGNAAVLMVIALSSMLDNKVKNLSVYLLLGIICVELVASVICLLMYAGTFSFAEYILQGKKKKNPEIELTLNLGVSLRIALKVFFAYTL